MTHPPAARDRHLDGLRGVAALVVVFCHFTLAFQPALLSGKPAQGAAAAAAGLSRTPLVLFWSPDCAVTVFFVLSGFVLAAAVSAAPPGQPALRLLASVVRRWIRLAGPIVGSSALILLLIESFGVTNAAAAALNGSDWLAMPFAWRAFAPDSPALMLRQSLFDIFASAEHWWNPALWTMPVEFWGSVGLFTLHAVSQPFPAWVRVVALASATTALLAGVAGPLAANAAGFGAGALLWEAARARTRRPPAVVPAPVRAAAAWIVGAAAFALAVLLGGTPYDMLGTPYLAAYVWAAQYAAEPVMLAHRIGAVLMVAATLAWSPLRWALNRAPVQALGRISFMVYLLHVVLICTLCSSLVLRLAPAWTYDTATAAAFAALLLVLLPLATVMTRLVDRPCITISRRAEQILLRWARPVPSHVQPAPKP